MLNTNLSNIIIKRLLNHKLIDFRCKEDIKEKLINSLFIHEDFISTLEEKSLFQEIDPFLKNLIYENDHWDDAIIGYRETEKKSWNKNNTKIIDKIKDTAFLDKNMIIPYIHILDLSKNGYIKPHVDSIKFCGNIIATLSILSASILRLSHINEDAIIDVLIPPKSLYIINSHVHPCLNNR
ncbi:unnamed protein product [Gordionus sp. m RMFG-2023]